MIRGVAAFIVLMMLVGCGAAPDTPEAEPTVRDDIRPPTAETPADDEDAAPPVPDEDDDAADDDDDEQTMPPLDLDLDVLDEPDALDQGLFDELTQPTLPLALTWGLPQINDAFNFLNYSWALFFGTSHAEVGPSRWRVPSEQGFFEAQPIKSGWWPLYEKMMLPVRFPGAKDEPVTRTHWFWPFVTTESGPQHSVFNLRPLLYYQRSPGLREWRVLYPLFVDRQFAGNRRTWLFPVFYRDYRLRKFGDQRGFDLDAFFLPLFFWGNDSREGRYFATFPVGGIIKGLLGKKWIRFVLFPLWVEARDLNYKSVNILWPIFGVWRGKEQHGWRIWPIFGKNIHNRKFRRYFLFWPLFHYWRFGLDTKYPGVLYAFFPLFMRRHTVVTGTEPLQTRMSAWNFLLVFDFKYHAERHWWEVHAPWPIFSYVRADGLRVLKFWPLYGHRQSNIIRHRFFLWPLYRFSLERKLHMLQRKWSILWIFNYRKTEWIETAEKTEDGFRIRRTAPPRRADEAWIPDPRQSAQLRKLREQLNPTRAQGNYRRTKTASLWPLFSWRRGPLDGVIFRSLALLPQGSQGAFAASYMPFTILFHYQRTFEGVREWRALLGLFRGRSTEISKRVNLLLLNYTRHGNRNTEIRWRRVKFLWGLLGYERVGKYKRIYFLWLPLGRIPEEARRQEQQEQLKARIELIEKSKRLLLEKMRPPTFDWEKRDREYLERRDEILRRDRDREALTRKVRPEAPRAQQGVTP